MFDFGQGDLRPDELAAHFQTSDKSSTLSTIRRKSHGCGPLSQRTGLNAEGYELLFDNVACKIEGAGYGSTDRKERDVDGFTAGKRRAELDMAMRWCNEPSASGEPG